MTPSTKARSHTHVSEEVRKRKSEKAARRKLQEPPEHAYWDFPPEFVHHPGEHGVPETMEHPEDVNIESICGAIDDSQPVEQYNGTLGVTVAFVMAHQAPVGQLQWNNNLAAIYTNPGNVSGVRWCSGTLISSDLFLSAGHCFDQAGGGWQRPLANGTMNVIPPAEIATNMHVNFNYQVDSMGVLRTEQSFPITALVEYRLGGLDFSIARLGGNPGTVYGWTAISTTDAAAGDMICIIQHPQGLPKRIEAGPAFHLHDVQIGYDSIDTLGGSSGSGILRSPDAKIVGVHTNGGCDAAMLGHNHGVRITSIRAVSPTIQALTTRKLKAVDDTRPWALKRLLDLQGRKWAFRDFDPDKRINDVKAVGFDARLGDPWRRLVNLRYYTGGAAPFILATPHHAMGVGDGPADVAVADADAIQAAQSEQLAQLEQAIQERADELRALEETYAALQADYRSIGS